MNNEKQTCKHCGGRGKFATTVMGDFGRGEENLVRCDHCCGFGVIYAERATEAGTPAKGEMPAPAHCIDPGNGVYFGAFSAAQMEAYRAAGAEEARREAAAELESWKRTNERTQGDIKTQNFAIRTMSDTIKKLETQLAAAQRTAGGDRGQRLAQFRRWLAETGALPRGSSWIGELESIVAGDGEPVAEAAAQADDGERVRAVPWTRETYIEQGWGHLLAAPTAQPTPSGNFASGNSVTGPTKVQVGARELVEAAQPTPPDEGACAAALRNIIKWNRQKALDKYGDANKAESWSCIREARAALRQPAAQPTQAGAEPAATDGLQIAITALQDAQQYIAASRQACWAHELDQWGHYQKGIDAIADLRARLASAGAGEVVDCRKIGGDLPVIISQGTAVYALEAMKQEYGAGKPRNMMADERSFVAAGLKELEAASNAKRAARQDSAAADKGE